MKGHSTLWPSNLPIVVCFRSKMVPFALRLCSKYLKYFTRRVIMGFTYWWLKIMAKIIIFPHFAHFLGCCTASVWHASIWDQTLLCTRLATGLHLFGKLCNSVAISTYLQGSPSAASFGIHFACTLCKSPFNLYTNTRSQITCTSVNITHIQVHKKRRQSIM